MIRVRVSVLVEYAGAVVSKRSLLSPRTRILDLETHAVTLDLEPLHTNAGP